jgi:peptidyl-prolyl cis-trans isomerase D
VEGPFGGLVIHIAKITPAAERSFDSMKSEIAADLTKERANDEVYKRSTKFEEARNGSAQFEDAAKANGAEVVSIAAADVDGKDPTGAPVKALEGRSAILADAFKGSPGTEPDLQETPGGGGYHLVRVDSVTPPAERPFDQVKAEIRKSLDEEKHRAALLKLAQDLAAKGKAGTSLDTFASGFGKAALKSPPLTRSAENDTFSTRAIQAVFAARQGDFVTAPVKSGTGVLLMQVDGVERPSAQEVAATFAQTKPQLGEMLSNELVTIYADSLRERYRVTVDEKALHSATGGS